MNRGTLAQSIRFGWPCVPGQSLERDQKSETAMVPCFVSALKLARRKMYFSNCFKLIWAVQSQREKYFFLRKSEIVF